MIFPSDPRRWTRSVLAGAAAWSAFAAASQAQSLGGGASTTVDPWRVAGALGLCLVLALVAALALRARMHARSGPAPAARPAGLGALTALLRPSAVPAEGRLRVLAQARLNPQVEIFLLECDARTLLVAASAQGVFVLDGARPKDGA